MKYLLRYLQGRISLLDSGNPTPSQVFNTTIITLKTSTRPGRQTVENNGSGCARNRVPLNWGTQHSALSTYGVQ